MKNRFVRLVLLGVLAFSATIAEALEAWVYGVSSNAGWYDNNKNGNGDYNLCWAAAASNVINWWQTYSNCPSSTAPRGDDVWATFKATCKEEMGNPYFAYEWFYKGDGGYPYFNYKDGATASGAYYKNENLKFAYEDTFTSEQNVCVTLLDLISNNYGISIAVYNDLGMRHAITLWGIDYNEDNTINSLYLTDSDDYTFAPSSRLFKVNKSVYSEIDSPKYTNTFVFDSYDKENPTSSESMWYRKYDYNSDPDDAIPVYNRIEGIYAVQLVNPIELPEPSTGVLVLTGLGLLLRRRRRVA